MVSDTVSAPAPAFMALRRPSGAANMIERILCFVWYLFRRIRRIISEATQSFNTSPGMERCRIPFF